MQTKRKRKSSQSSDEVSLDEIFVQLRERLKELINDYSRVRKELYEVAYDLIAVWVKMKGIDEVANAIGCSKWLVEDVIIKKTKPKFWLAYEVYRKSEAVVRDIGGEADEEETDKSET